MCVLVVVVQEIQVLQSRFDKVDEVATELKLQVVELQLEKADCEQHLEGEITQLKVLCVPLPLIT